MRNFIIHSTIFSVFSEALYVNYIIDWKLFYIIIFINFTLLAIFFPIIYSRKVMMVLGLIFGFGVLNILLGTNTFPRLSSQLLGILIVYLYYHNFFNATNESIANYFRIYSNYAFYISVVGLVIFVFKIVLTGVIEPLKSITTEPSHFSTLVLPACFYFLKNKALKYHLLKFSIILLSIILSFSSLGIMGIMIGLLLLPKHINPVRLVLPVVLGVVSFVLLLNYVPNFSARVEDSFTSFTEKDVTGANLSSYALISNLFVASDSFSHNPLFGGGLGSHVISHEKVIGSISGSSEFGELIGLNSQDANSLFIRVVSELGLFGLVLIFWFIVKFYSSSSEQSRLISRAIIIYFFCKLLREGHYFSPEMYFFILAYWYNSKQATLAKKKRLDLEKMQTLDMSFDNRF